MESSSVMLGEEIDGPLAVIGDVHGHAALLAELLDWVRVEAPDFDGRYVCFLGDFLDRGPNPRGAVEAALACLDAHPRTTAVCGNHDHALAAALGLFETAPELNWATRYLENYDAGPTFRSYGVRFGDLDGLREAMPPRHRAFLAALPWRVVHPDYVVVHAGLLPDEPYEAQMLDLARRPREMNRPPWLCDHRLAREAPPEDCPKTVVSGHVWMDKVIVEGRRILVDTSGGMRPCLSAVLLPERRPLTVWGDGWRRWV